MHGNISVIQQCVKYLLMSVSYNTVRKSSSHIPHINVKGLDMDLKHHILIHLAPNLLLLLPLYNLVTLEGLARLLLGAVYLSIVGRDLSCAVAVVIVTDSRLIALRVTSGAVSSRSSTSRGR